MNEARDRAGLVDQLRVGENPGEGVVGDRHLPGRALSAGGGEGINQVVPGGAPDECLQCCRVRRSVLEGYRVVVLLGG